VIGIGAKDFNLAPIGTSAKDFHVAPRLRQHSMPAQKLSKDFPNLLSSNSERKSEKAAQSTIVPKAKTPKGTS